MYNINTRYPPADNQQNVPVHQQNEQQPFAVRRPTGGTSQIASSSMHPGAFQRPNHPPLQNQSVDRRTRQNNHLFNLIRNNNLISSTLILQRPHTQSRQPLNLLQDAGCQINDSIYQRELPTTDWRWLMRQFKPQPVSEPAFLLETLRLAEKHFLPRRLCVRIRKKNPSKVKKKIQAKGKKNSKQSEKKIQAKWKKILSASRVLPSGVSRSKLEASG